MTSCALSLLIAATTIGSTAPAGPPDGVFEPPPSIRHQIEEAEQKQAAYEAFVAAHGADVKNWASELPPPTFDVLRYELDLHVDPDRQILSGSVTVAIEAIEDGLAEIALDADLGLRILSVIQLGEESHPYDSPVELGFDHAEDTLSIALANPRAARRPCSRSPTAVTPGAAVLSAPPASTGTPTAARR
jgi:hypothetical protein